VRVPFSSVVVVISELSGPGAAIVAFVFAVFDALEQARANNKDANDSPIDNLFTTAFLLRRSNHFTEGQALCHLGRRSENHFPELTGSD
jgi:hypothetical protein